MAILAALLSLAAIGIIRGFPDSTAGRMLRRQLAERPIAAMAKINRHHVIFFGLLVLMALTTFKFAAFFGTDFFVAFTSFDMSLYLDAVCVSAALAAFARLRLASQFTRSCIQRLARSTGLSRNKPRGPRSRAYRRTPRQSANDEDGPLPTAIAA